MGQEALPAPRRAGARGRDPLRLATATACRRSTASPAGRVFYVQGRARDAAAALHADRAGRPARRAPRRRLAKAMVARAGRAGRLRGFACSRWPCGGCPARRRATRSSPTSRCSGWSASRIRRGPRSPARWPAAATAGIRVIMVTGDHPRTALAVGRQIGLVRDTEPRRRSPATRCAAFTDTQLQLALDAPEILFARMDADQKLRVVQALQHKGEVVAVTGDGVNDAPALKAADIGVAMGRQPAPTSRAKPPTSSSRRQLCQHRARHRGGPGRLRQHPQVPHLHPDLERSRTGAVRPLRAVSDSVAAHHRADPRRGSRHRPGAGAGARRRAAGSGRHGATCRVARRSGCSPRRCCVRAYVWLGLFESLAGMALYAYVLSRGGWQWGQPLASGDPLYLEATTACLWGSSSRRSSICTAAEASGSRRSSGESAAIR